MLSKLQLAGIVAAGVIFLGLAGAIVWLKRDNDHLNSALGAAEQRVETAIAAAAKNKSELETFKAQHAGAEAVAAAVSRALEEQRVDFENQNRRTYSAPIEKNRDLPSSLVDTYDWLQQRREAARSYGGAGGPAGAAGGAPGVVPGRGPADAAPQLPAGQRR